MPFMLAPDPAVVIDGSAKKPVTRSQIEKAVTRASENLRLLPVSALQVDANGVVGGSLQYTRTGLSNVCTKAEMPARFLLKAFDRSPEESRDLFNAILRKMPESARAVVTQDGLIQGVVSEDHYRRLPNHAVADMVLERPALFGEVVGFHMHGLVMRLTTGCEPMTLDPQNKKDVGTMGISIINGDDGVTAFSAEGYVYRLICKNGMMGWARSQTGRVSHTGSSVMERALTLAINTARESTGDMQDMVQRSTRVEWTLERRNDFIHRHKDDMGERWLRSVAEAVPESPGRLYDAWNEVTVRGHSTKRIDERVEIQRFAGKFLRDAVRRYALN